ncbi:hypothetical protein HZH68_000552 [Vespula germanica]|uniref:Uncharacterized protein n=3 Tax=Vespula TaxID=7451 RepID=A0A834NTT2_VESGE|nr:hypothetical protein HZH66_000506 [Vespula vulgaris]KAF7417899.1 hypothetical protein HZH68_000552 [Vespula germanica]KAF7438193.1 hypothetical protein H0235_000584 [Vespula pensylvanica]
MTGKDVMKERALLFLTEKKSKAVPPIVSMARGAMYDDDDNDGNDGNDDDDDYDDDESCRTSTVDVLARFI